MARVVLVLVLLVLSPGGGLSPALAEDCDAATDKAMTKGGTQVKEGEKQVIINMTIEESEDTVNLFVKPESGFKGVRLDLHGSNGTHHVAWFLVEPKCFLQNKWHQTQAWANTNTDDSTSFSLGFDIWKCKMECRIDSPTLSQYNLSVVAHGASKWLTGNAPQQCTIKYLATSYHFNVTTCMEPPAPTTTTTSTTTTTTTTTTVTVPLHNQTQWQTTTNPTSDQDPTGDNLWVVWVVGVVVGVLVLVGVLVGVLVYLRNRRRRRL